MAIIQEIKQEQDTLTQWRRDIHQNPELAYEEHDTASFVASCLKEWGIETQTGIGKTGVVGVLKGKTDTSGRSIALRADMDALPLCEKNTFDHKSKNDGKMHACGHDGHTTMLLGAAQYLARTRDFDGTVYFVFQPAEEGQAGAKAMIDDGLFDRFPCDSIYGLHNWPGLPEGHFSICPGPMTASSDTITITLTGQGGHGSMPHRNTDIVTTGAEIIMALQTLISRKVSPNEAAVLSLCTFNAGTGKTAMPSTAEIGGTVRCYSEEVRKILLDGIENIVSSLCAAHGVEGSVDVHHVTPSVYNDPDEAIFMAEVAADVVGGDRADTTFTKTTASEDFAYFSQVKKAAYIAMGQGEKHPQLHNTLYDFNDNTLATGASFWVRLVEMKLKSA